MSPARRKDDRANPPRTPPTADNTRRPARDEHLEHVCQGGLCLEPHAGHVPDTKPHAAASNVRGRGDAHIRDDVLAALAACPQVDAGGVRIDVHGGIVTLHGVVRSRRQKSAVEIVAESCHGVKGVHNDVRTKPDGRTRMPRQLAGKSRRTAAR